MARQNGITPGKLPEFLTSPSLGEWMSAKIADWVERDEAEAREAGMTRVRAVEHNMAKTAGAQIAGYHAEDAA